MTETLKVIRSQLAALPMSERMHIAADILIEANRRAWGSSARAEEMAPEDEWSAHKLRFWALRWEVEDAEAGQRESAVLELATVLGNGQAPGDLLKGFAERVYDAGYRKVDES